MNNNQNLQTQSPWNPVRLIAGATDTSDAGPILESLPQFSGLPRATLLSISALSGESYRRVGWEDLKAELERRGVKPEDDDALYEVMEALSDGGYVDCYFMSALAPNLFALIKQAVRRSKVGRAYPDP